MITDFIPDTNRDQFPDKSDLPCPSPPRKGLVITGLTVAVILIFAFGIWIRFQDLGKMAYHHDESIHAYYSWQLFQKGPYHPDNKVYPTYYDPVYHGPFLYHIGALTFFLFGDSDITGRLPFAVSGVFLLFVAWELRHILGKRTAVLILLLCAISPVLTYFARFARNDTYVGAECLALIYCALRYFRASREEPEGQSRWGWFLGMVFFLVIHYCTKENSYAHGAIYCSFLGLYAFYRLVIHSALKEGLSKRLPILAFLALAVLSFFLLFKGIETIVTKDTESFFPKNIVVHKLAWNSFTYAGLSCFLVVLVLFVLDVLAIKSFRQKDPLQRVQVVISYVFAFFIYLLGFLL